MNQFKMCFKFSLDLRSWFDEVVRLSEMIRVQLLFKCHVSCFGKHAFLLKDRHDSKWLQTQSYEVLNNEILESKKQRY